MDNIPPGCETDAGCLIPPAGPEGERALRLRSMITGLGGLIGPGAVLSALGAGMEDLVLLHAIEDEIKKYEKETGDDRDRA